MIGIPVHPFTEGVTVTVAVVPALVAVKPGMLPEPEVPKPTLAELVQVKEAPALLLLNEIPPTPAPLQGVMLATGLTVAIGLI